MPTPADNADARFADLVACAELANDSLEAYDARQARLLARLDDFADPPALTCEAQYPGAWAIKRALGSLSCFTFNTNHPENDRVWDLEAAWGKRLHAWNRRALLTNEDDRLVARALLATRYLSDLGKEALFEAARARGLLRLEPDYLNVCVVGLYRKIGDNVFTLDDRGRHHRQYKHCVGRQAIGVALGLPWDQAGNEAFRRSLPPLDPGYHVCFTGDCKGGVQHSRFTRADWQRLRELIRTSEPRIGGAAPARAPQPLA